MADAVDTLTFEDAAQAVSQGKRHLLVRDYTMAVAALAEGCRMLADKHGEMSDELGEPFLLYGRALLCLSREEAGVLGSGVPGGDDEEGEDGEDGEAAEGDEEGENGEEEEEEDGAAEKAEDGGEESKSKTGDKAAEPSGADDKPEKASEKSTAEAKTDAKATNGTAESSASSRSEKPGSSGGAAKLTNGDAASTSKAYQNGDAGHEDGEDDAEDVDNEDDDDANSNLQLAWEILELAKLILLKRGETGWKLLSEAHRLLGEVAMESGNQPGALTDLNACLDLLRKIDPADPRSMAETHYQLGLAYSLGNDFDASIEQFNEATSLLEARIKDLQELSGEPPKPADDPFYTVEGEIKELRELLPEIQEKISDMRDFKQQACKLVIEGIKSRVAGGSCSNGGASTSGEGSSSSSGGAGSSAASSKAVGDASKPASDISHLVRKKRKTDEESEHSSPCKKATAENIA